MASAEPIAGDWSTGPEFLDRDGRRLPETPLERVDRDHLRTLCRAAPLALRGPTPV
jgi:hypothetical protein